MFEGFSQKSVVVGDVTINLMMAGSGSPLLLLHGYPQTLSCWHEVAPRLTEEFTVVCCDLRGHGDSEKPADDAAHETYCKRTLARDQHGLMAKLGFGNFSVVGHGDGGAVAHRLALDHPHRVDHLVLLENLPTPDGRGHRNRDLSRERLDLSLLARRHDLPERLIAANPDDYFQWSVELLGDGSFLPVAAASEDYLRCFRQPSAIHAVCARQRAHMSLDMLHDLADREARIRCRMLILWSSRGRTERPFTTDEVWPATVQPWSAQSIDSGYFMAEEAPAAVCQAIARFLAE